jgi:hypothetical protein
MEQIKQFFKWETQSGKPISVGQTTVTPKSQSLSIRFPYGGFVWNRPVSVAVEREGRTEEIPIVDVTRMALIAVTVAGFALAIIGRMWSAARRKRST